MEWITLSASLIGLWVGPLLALLAGRAQRLLSLLDGYVVVAMLGLVGMELLPRALNDQGLWGLVAVGLGMLLPTWLEQRTARAQGAALVVAILGLMLHTAFDGAALAFAASHAGHDHGHGHAHNTSALSFALILHRLPVGLLVFLALKERVKSRWIVGVLVMLCLSTWLGWTGAQFVPPATSSWVSLFEAFVVGSLLHVVMHQHGTESDEASPFGRSLWQALGGIAGLATLIVIAHEPIAPSLNSAHWMSTQTAWELGAAMAPALIVALVVHAMMSVLRVPRVRWFDASVLVALPLFGWAWGTGIAVTMIGTRWGIDRLMGARSAPESSRYPLREGFGAMLDRALPWALCGIGVAALMEPMGWLASSAHTPWYAIGLFLMALPLALHPAGALPIAAVMLHQDVSLWAVLAFVLAGGLLNMRDAQHVWRTGGKMRLLAILLLIVVVCAASVWASQAVAPEHIFASHASTPISWTSLPGVCVAILGVCVVISWFRQGPRGMLAQILGQSVHEHESKG